MLRGMDKDRLTLVKADGQVAREDVRALVAGETIFTSDETLPLEVGDHLLRKLPNGLVEDYEITDPKFYNVGRDPHFQIKFRRVGAPKQEATVIHGITNNFHGANSRVNILSTDSSTNVSADVSPEKLRDFIEQVRPVISQLPQADQGAVAAQLGTLEEELGKTAPSNMRILGALQSIKTVAEGAAGNLVASGIIGLITALL